MPEIKTKVKTNVVTIVFVALAIALAAVGVEIFIPDVISTLMPPAASLPATAVMTTNKPAPKGSAFFPYWQLEKIGGDLPVFYTVNGSNMGSGDINPSTGQAYIRMTKYTNNIGTLAASIPNGANRHNTVANIMNWMHDPKKGNIQGGACGGVEKWSRSADQILQSHCATGCTDWTTAFIALARAKGIAASSVDLVSDRWITESKNAGCMKSPKIGHYVADVYTGTTANNGWELADPTTGVFTVYQGNDFTSYALMRFNAYNPGAPLQTFGSGYKYRILRRAIDAWDGGITADNVWRDAVIAAYQLPSNLCK